MHNSKEPYAVITDASSGIGYELAQCFARDKISLLISARDESKLNQAAEALRMAGAPNVEAVPVDLGVPQGAPKLFQAAQQKEFEVEYLVANAGAGVYGDFFRKTDLYEETRMIQLNVVSVVQLTKLFGQLMIQRGSGKILITSSVTAKAVSPHLTVYSATKAFTHTFAEGLANEAKGSGVTVTSLLPDAVETNFFKAAHMEDTNIGSAKKADPAQVAAIGYQAMKKGEDYVIAPPKSRVTAAIASLLPESFVAEKAKAK
jgi:uncharacterized protein